MTSTLAAMYAGDAQDQASHQDRLCSADRLAPFLQDGQESWLAPGLLRDTKVTSPHELGLCETR